MPYYYIQREIGDSQYFRREQQGEVPTTAGSDEGGKP